MTQGCFDFGRQLIESQDLDPVYVLLYFCPEIYRDQETLERWLLAYWCFYHVGTASWIASGDYWDRMYAAAGSKEYPRCPERRHFRGQNAIKSVTYLEHRGLASLFRNFTFPVRRRSCGEVMKEVQQWVGFGPWIAFKVADMVERLNLAPIRFGTEDVYLFDSPKKGAERLRESLGEDVGGGRTETWAVERILAELGDLRAPPRDDRPIGPQEAETVLCKWYSHTKGSYEVGEDTEACRQSLLKFAKVRLCQNLLQAGRKADLWSR